MPPVLEIMLYPMRDGVNWGATVKWSEQGEQNSLRILGAASRELLLGVIGRLFDRRSGGTIDGDESP